MEQLSHCWEIALELIELMGWSAAEEELTRRIDSLRLMGSDQEEIDSNLLVLATLQQKFGTLDKASLAFSELEQSHSPQIANDARVRLGKVFSQKGEFQKARTKLLELFPEKSSTAFLSQPDGVSGSALWRVGFLCGMSGNRREAQYWFARHLDVTHSHGSQYANNTVFNNLVDISTDTFELNKAIEKNREGVCYYLQDTLSVDSVKYINISKSVVVPLLLDGVLLFIIGDSSSGLLQIMLCRRLIQIEGLTYESEGIAETLYSLKMSGSSEVNSLAHAFCSDERSFNKWAFSVARNDKTMRYLIGEREERIKSYIQSRDYSLITVDKAICKISTPIRRKRGDEMRKDKSVFLIHGHDELNLLRLKNFISDECSLRPIILKDEPNRGSTLIEKFESHATECSYAIAIFTMDDMVDQDGGMYLQPRPNVIFELGWFYGKLGRDKVLILFQSGVKIPSDLAGIVTIEFSSDITEGALEILREIKS